MGIKKFSSPEPGHIELAGSLLGGHILTLHDKELRKVRAERTRLTVALIVELSHEQEERVVAELIHLQSKKLISKPEEADWRYMGWIPSRVRYSLEAVAEDEDSEGQGDLFDDEEEPDPL